MRLIFHGILRDLYGESVTMQADSVADALEGFSRQQSNWPKDLKVSIPGFRSEEKLRESAREIHLVPSFLGGGGKFGSIILGAITVVVGILLLATPFGVPLIISGGMMILQGVIALFLKSPKIKNVEDPEASKYLPVNQNTTKMGTPIILAWGRTKIAGHWLSLQSDSTNLSYGVFPANPT